MDGYGRILIADDEESFLKPTTELLRRAGYRCDPVRDGVTAEKRLKEHVYDLLISDIRMDGNNNLELVNKLPGIAHGLPVILVTGYPSIDSAVPSIKLPVIAYLAKPVEFSELLSYVKIGVRDFKLYRAICRSQEKLNNWQAELQEFRAELGIKCQPSGCVSVDTFVKLNFQNILGALVDLKKMVETLVFGKEGDEMCQLFNCPRLKVFREATIKTIDVLKKTKDAFRSKQLAELRKILEELMKNPEAE